MFEIIGVAATLLALGLWTVILLIMVFYKLAVGQYGSTAWLNWLFLLALVGGTAWLWWVFITGNPIEISIPNRGGI